MFESSMQFLTLKVIISLCEFVCQFHRDSYNKFQEDEEQNALDSDQSDSDGKSMGVLARVDTFHNNLEYNISDLLNWDFFVNYYQSNDHYDNFEK